MMNRIQKNSIVSISRLLLAVFLFLLISPSLYAKAGDDVSGNEAEDEDEVVDYITNYYTGIYTSYTGALTNNWDSIKDVVTDGVTVIQDQYERYDAVADYFRPHVSIFVSSDEFKDLHQGKQICNIDFMSDILQDLTDSLADTVSDAVMMELPEKQHSGLFSYAELPPGVYFSAKDVYSMCSPKDSNWNGIADGSAVVATFENRGYYVAFATIASDYDSDSRSKITLKWYNGDTFDVGFTAIKKDGNTFTSFTNNGSRSMSYNYIDSRYGFTYGQGNVATINGSRATGNNFLRTVISGSTYISVEKYNGIIYNYYWNQDTLNLVFIGNGSYNDFDNQEGEQVAGDNVYNIYNDLDFDEYADEINALLSQINQQVTLNNQLTLQLLKKIGINQYQPQEGDTIDDFWSDLLSKLLDIATNGLPVVTPDLNGIAGALASLLDFLSSIVDAISNIVTSLLDGIFHLVVPTQDQWDELSINFQNMMEPVSWIKDFVIQASRMFSYLLFGEDITEFEESSSSVRSASVADSSFSGNTKSMSTETVETSMVMSKSSAGTRSVATLSKSSGIGEAPKVAVHFGNSESQYFSSVGDCYILDLSWYTPYKPVGDTIIVAFCWIMFLWRVFHDLPNIVNGSSGMFDNGTYDETSALRKEFAFDKLHGFRR